MSKHKYTVIFNEVDEDIICYTYTYGNTKDIELKLSKTGFAITVKLGKIYNADEILSADAYLFPDGIKKAALLYLIQYEKNIIIKTVTIDIDGYSQIRSFNDDAMSPIYSMINGRLLRRVSTRFTDRTVCNHLLKTPKTAYDKRIASLFSLLLSKSKEYETERFLYLWTCFNGMYSWLSEHIAKANGVDKYRKEYIQIQGLQCYLNEGKATIKDKYKARIANEVSSKLKNVKVDGLSREAFVKAQVDNEISAVLDCYLDEGECLTAYGYLLTQFSYYYRCKIIHGSKPVILFCYEKDRDLHNLRIINALLEEWIDENLPLWFDEEYIERIIIPKVNEIILP